MNANEKNIAICVYVVADCCRWYNCCFRRNFRRWSGIFCFGTFFVSRFSLSSVISGLLRCWALFIIERHRRLLSWFLLTLFFCTSFVHYRFGLFVIGVNGRHRCLFLLPLSCCLIGQLPDCCLVSRIHRSCDAIRVHMWQFVISYLAASVSSGLAPCPTSPYLGHGRPPRLTMCGDWVYKSTCIYGRIWTLYVVLTIAKWHRRYSLAFRTLINLVKLKKDPVLLTFTPKLLLIYIYINGCIINEDVG